MARQTKNRSNRPDSYKEGSWYNSLSAPDKDKLNTGREPPYGIKHNCSGGKRRSLPEHILRMLAQPEYRDEVLPTLGLEDSETNASPAAIPNNPDTPVYYSRLKVEPTARCCECEELFKLSAIRYHKKESLGPEHTICIFCYRDLKCSNGGTVPAPVPKQNNSPCASWLGRKAIGIEEKEWLVTAALEDYTKGSRPTQAEVDAAINIFVDSLVEPDEYNRYPIELYFDRKHRLSDIEALLSDYVDSIAELSVSDNLEVIEWEI